MDSRDMCEFVLIRHGMTKANAERRYAGRTDYPLLEEGKHGLLSIDYSPYTDAEKIFVSPLLRCRQSADIIFPGREKVIIPGLIECDFGRFEDRSADEMSDDEEYRQWVDSGGTKAFPGGEDVEEFKDRCADAMVQIMDICRKEGISKAAAVTHGGVIMSVMERLCTDQRQYYEWHPENGRGYVVRARCRSLELLKEL